MHKGVPLILVALSVVGEGCDRFKKTSPPVPDASFDNTSHVAMGADITHTEAFELTGPAFAKFDKENNLLVIAIADPKNNPAPTCDLFDAAAAGTPMQSGAMATLTVMGIADARPGNYQLLAASYLKSDPSDGGPNAGGMSMGGGIPDSATIKITQLDSSSLVAEVPDATAGKPFASVRATMCKPGPIMPQGAVATGDPTAMVTGDPQALGAMPRPSFIDMEFPDGKKQQTGGEDALVKLDPKAKLLAIYVWQFGLSPAPTCETFATAPKDVMYGQFAMVSVASYSARKKGKFKVAGGEFFDLEVAPPSITSDVGTFDATTIEITDFNDGIFNATISSSAKAKTKITGKLNAAVCPDGPIHFPKEKKKKK